MWDHDGMGKYYIEQHKMTKIIMDEGTDIQNIFNIARDINLLFNNYAE